jgi:hypothetical protein
MRLWSIQSGPWSGFMDRGHKPGMPWMPEARVGIAGIKG